MNSNLINGKIVLIGESGVGKTSLNNRYIYDMYNSHLSPTTGSNFFTKVINFEGKEMKIGIWDTAGQEIYRSLSPMYIKNSHGVMLVFDITNRDSFEQIPYWINTCNNILIEKADYILVGNKLDLENQRKISIDEAELFAQNHGIKYIETSTKNKANVNEAFSILANQVFNRLKMMPEKNDVAIHTIEKKRNSIFKRLKWC